MSRAYSRIARSLENFPILAVFRIAIFNQRDLSRKAASTFFLALLTVRLKVRQAKERVAVVEIVAKHAEHARRLIGREVVGANPVDNSAQFLVLVIVFFRIVALLEEGANLLDGESEDEDVVIANFLLHFDVGAIERADGEGAVEGRASCCRCRCGLLSGGVEICSETSAAGMISSARVTPLVGKEATLSRLPRMRGSLLIFSAMVLIA